MLKLTAKKSRWFDVPQDPDGDCKVHILHLKPGEVADIESKTNKLTAKQIGEDMGMEIDISPRENVKRYVEACVLGWEGFMSVNGKSLECTTANKMKVLKEYDWFGDFVTECRETLREEVVSEEEEREKN